MFDKINEELKNSLKSGDKFKLSVLRMVKSALQLETINKKCELSDDDVVSVLKRQVKQRNDSLCEYERLGKVKAVDDLKKEIEIISAYLPEEASIEQINTVINDAFKELNPTSMKEMGLVMKYITDHLKNADMTIISQIVKKRLLK